MKHIPSFEQFLNEKFDDSDEHYADMMLLNFYSFAAGEIMGIQWLQSSSGFHHEEAIENIPDAIYHKWRSNKTIKKIIDRMKKDSEITNFLQLSKKEQGGKLEKLMEPKLTNSEKQYIIKSYE